MKFKSILTGVLAILLVGGVALANGKSDCSEREEPREPAAPAITEPTRSDSQGAWVDVNCDTDFERATYEECCGMPYELWLQDHPYSEYINRLNGTPAGSARPGIFRLNGQTCE
jgi:hypothetical protein